AVSAVVLTNWTQTNFFKNIPLLGQYITCSQCPDPAKNKESESTAVPLETETISKSVNSDQLRNTECKGICHHCKMTKGIVVIGSYIFTDGMISLINSRFGTNI